MKKRFSAIVLALLFAISPALALATYAKADKTNNPQEQERHYIAWPFITYAEPDFMAERKGGYSPQAVKILERNDSGWALIDTFNGAWWVYLNDDMRYVDRSMEIYDNRGDIKSVTMIGPQVVKILEENGDWLQIETWLGSKWIYMGVQDVYLDLVNKSNALSNDYIPNDLVLVGNNQFLRERAANAFAEMHSAMNKEGLFLTARSGYRSYGTQQFLFNQAVSNYGLASAERWNARPGQSEHQTGLALDVLQKGFTGSPLSNARFQNTRQFEWLTLNAHKYGFILRYPQGYESITGFAFEPWHWRYIGVEPASYMKENGIAAFEEYIGEIQKITNIENADSAFSIFETIWFLAKNKNHTGDF